MKIILIILLSFIGYSSHAQIGRLENEYKLSVPDDETDTLWQYIIDNYGANEVSLSSIKLRGTSSTEIFYDTYFDNNEKILFEKKMGVRHRKRYKDAQLINEIVQLKMPKSDDGIIRNEIKFDIKNKLNKTYHRHPLLKFLTNEDITNLGFYISSLNIRPVELNPEVQLRQNRKRIYLSNSQKENYLTITLDKVSNQFFPYQSFTELEIELNEIRYTDAHEEEKLIMSAVSEELKESIHTNFPNIKVNQTPKYNKMSKLINENWLSSIGDGFVWLIYGFIICLATLKAYKLKFS